MAIAGERSDCVHVVPKHTAVTAPMGFAVRIRSAGQKYGPTCHQMDRADVTEFVTLVRLSSLGQHVGVLALAGYKRRKSALTAGPIVEEAMAFQERLHKSGVSYALFQPLLNTATICQG